MILAHKFTTNRTKGRLRKDNSRKLFNNYRCINKEKGTCTSIGISHAKVEKAFLNYLVFNIYSVVPVISVISETVVSNGTGEYNSPYEIK